MNVYKLINMVTSELAESGIAKTQVNQHQKYRFRGIDDVYNSLAKILSKVGLIILPRVVSHKQEIKTNPQKGSVSCYTILEVEYDFISSEDGSKHTIKVFGEGIDTSDKSTNKAMSAAYKYACIQAFCIPIEGSDDADKDHIPLSAEFSKELVNELKKLIEHTGSDENKILAYFSVESIESMNTKQLSQGIQMLKKKVEKIKEQEAA
jgi:hypothetical protein